LSPGPAIQTSGTKNKPTMSKKVCNRIIDWGIFLIYHQCTYAMNEGFPFGYFTSLLTSNKAGIRGLPKRNTMAYKL